LLAGRALDFAACGCGGVVAIRRSARSMRSAISRSLNSSPSFLRGKSDLANWDTEKRRQFRALRTRTRIFASRGVNV